MTEAIRIIRKYPNRRLYDTSSSSYITLADIKTLVLDRVGFRVLDAKTNDDLTRCILLQIILEQENGGIPLFSSEMLSQIIRCYGHAMQNQMGNQLAEFVRDFIESPCCTSDMPADAPSPDKIKLKP